MKTITMIVLVAFMAVQAQTQEVKGLKQVLDITVDDLGNANIEVTVKLNASQWDYYKKSLGTNTSVVKRNMERGLPKYFLSDFVYTEDQMERTYKVKFKALGLATINDNGKWESKLDTKDPDFTKLTEREFVINSDMMSGGTFINQTQKIHLPASAEDAKIEKDSFGKAVLTYKTNIGGTSKALMYAGIAMILGSGFLFFRNMRGPKNKLRVAKAA